VRAQDAAGNVDASPATDSWTVTQKRKKQNQGRITMTACIGHGKLHELERRETSSAHTLTP